MIDAAPQVALRVLEEITLHRRRFPDFAEFFVILARHDNVHIVVPRNEALMPHRPDRRPVKQRVADLMRLTVSVNRIQNVQLCILKFF